MNKLKCCGNCWNYLYDKCELYLNKDITSWRHCDKWKFDGIKPKDRKFIAEAPSRIASLIRYIRQLEGK